jgi:hypothetical protein
MISSVLQACVCDTDTVEGCFHVFCSRLSLDGERSIDQRTNDKTADVVDEELRVTFRHDCSKEICLVTVARDCYFTIASSFIKARSSYCRTQANDIEYCVQVLSR